MTASNFLNKKNLVTFFRKFLPLIGIAILIYLIIDIGPNKILSTFLLISPLNVLLSISLTVPLLLIRNFAWIKMQRLQRIHMSYFRSLKITLIGYFYGAITPGYLGQLMRIPYMKEETNEPLGKLFVNNIIEAVLRTFALYIMMILGALLLISRLPNALPITCLILTAFIIFYSMFIKKERGEAIFHFLIKILIPRKAKPFLTQFVNTFYKDFPSLKKLIVPFLLGVPTWIILYSQIYILGMSLDVEIPYFAFILLYPIANVISFLPITSAGLGTREAALIFLFSFYGVPPEKTMVISLAGYVFTDLLTGLCGFVVSVVEAKNNRIFSKKLGSKEETSSYLFRYHTF